MRYLLGYRDRQRNRKRIGHFYLFQYELSTYCTFIDSLRKLLIVKIEHFYSLKFITKKWWKELCVLWGNSQHCIKLNLFPSCFNEQRDSISKMLFYICLVMTRDSIYIKWGESAKIKTVFYKHKATLILLYLFIISMYFFSSIAGSAWVTFSVNRYMVYGIWYMVYGHILE